MPYKTDKIKPLEDNPLKRQYIVSHSDKHSRKKAMLQALEDISDSNIVTHHDLRMLPSARHILAGPENFYVCLPSVEVISISEYGEILEVGYNV